MQDGSTELNGKLSDQEPACPSADGSLYSSDAAPDPGKEQEVLFTCRCFRLYPAGEQAQALAQWIGCARVAYNAKVQTMEDVLASVELFKADMSYSGIRNQDKLWLDEVPAEILRNAVYHFKQAAARWSKRLAKRPTYHKKWKNDTILLTRELIRFEETGKDSEGHTTYKLIIGNSGYMISQVPFHAHQDFTPPAAITITHTASAWFLSFCNELLPEEMALIHMPEELLEWSKLNLPEGLPLGIASVAAS